MQPSANESLPWFHGKITRAVSEERLSPWTSGKFLVRESTYYPGDYTLCVCSMNTVQHYKIINNNGVYLEGSSKFKTLKDLIRYERTEGNLKADLNKPVARPESIQPTLVPTDDNTADVRGIQEACKQGDLDAFKLENNRLTAVMDKGLVKFKLKSTHEPLEAARKGGHNNIIRYILFKLWTKQDSSDSSSGPANQQEVTSQICRLQAKWQGRLLSMVDESWLQPINQNDIIVSIDLSNNKIGSIPTKLLWGLPHLESLKLQHCWLGEIPSPDSRQQLGKLRLRHVDFSNNSLRTMHDDLFMIRTLQTVELHHNVLQSIGTGQEAPTDSLHGSYVNARPQWLCSGLQCLQLSYNYLTILPHRIRDALNLKELDVSKNQMSELPAPWDCPLVLFNARGNKLRQFQAHQMWKVTLKTLNLSQNNITDFPDSICELISLEELNLSKNKIRKLPSDDKWKTYRLVIMDLSDNLLLFTSDDAIDKFKQRSKIRLSKDLPEWFLDYDPAKIEYLQFEIPVMLHRQLRKLIIAKNRLQAFPTSILKMTNLQILDISDNDLREIPADLGSMGRLYNLQTTNLRIKTPAEVGSILNKYGSDNSTHAVMEALRKRLLNLKPYRGVKLIIIGPTQSGKSTLMESLSEKEIRQDQKVNVTEWHLPISGLGISKAKSIVFTVWDVKGCHEKSIASSLFTKNTLYLLVWDIRDADDESKIREIEDYMLNVKFTAPGCRIIAVGTHIDQQRGVTIKTLSSVLKKSHLGSIIFKEKFVDASTRRGKGMKELVQAIKDYTLSMKTNTEENRNQKIPFVGREIPHIYTTTRSALSEKLSCKQEGKEPRFITGQECINQSGGNVLKMVDMSQHAIDFLQESGSLIHVNDHTYRLNNLYFLDPNWLCEVLSSVLKFKSSQPGSQPSLKTEDLKECCNKSGFSDRFEEDRSRDRFEEYKDILSRYEIALETDTDSYIRPSMLSGPIYSENETIFNYAFKLMRWYVMKLLPPGLWSRVICRIASDINQQNRSYGRSSATTTDRLDVWNSGMLLKSVNGVTEVTLVTELHDNTTRKVPEGSTGICIFIRSKNELDFQKRTGFIVDHIDSILREWYHEFEDALHSRLVACPICMKSNRILQVAGQVNYEEAWKDSSFMELNDLIVAAILKKQNNITKCKKKHHAVPIQDEAHIPDILLLDLQVPIIPTDSLVIGRKLGEGGYGVVHKATYEGQDIALKSLLKEAYRSDATVEEQQQTLLDRFQDYRREAVTTNQMKHPFIIQLIGVSIEKLSMALEFAPLGNLNDLLIQHMALENRSTSNTVSKNIFHGTLLDRILTFKIVFQIIAAVKYSHQQGFIHTDLKTDNIMVFSTDPNEYVNVKLADYGISQKKVNAGVVRGQAGGHVFVAPEVNDGKVYNEKADIFSIGMIVFNVLSGVSPAGHDSNIITTFDTAGGDRPIFAFRGYTMEPGFIQMEEVMKECWNLNPNKRPSASVILKRMQEIDFLHLRNVVMEKKTNVCFARTVLMTSDCRERLCIWSSCDTTDHISVTSIDPNSLKIEGVHRTIGHQVKSAITVIAPDNMHIIAHKVGISVLESDVRGYITSGTEERTTKEKRFVVSCLLIVPDNTKIPVTSSAESIFYLYAGSEDGRVIVYKHTPTSEQSENMPIFEHVKDVGFVSDSRDKPCTCMINIPEEYVVLVGYGNTIGVIDTRKHVVCIDQSCSVPGQRGSTLKELVYSSGYIFGFFIDSSDLVLFSINPLSFIDAFRCDQKKSHTEDKVPNNRNSQQRYSLRDGLANSGTVEKHKSRFDGDCKHRSAVIECLLVTEKVLWVGRSNGDVLLLKYRATKDGLKSEFLAILDPQPASIGFKEVDAAPFVCLYKTKANKIVMCRRVSVRKEGEAEEEGYQVLVWEKFGEEDSSNFQKYISIY